VHQPLLDFGSGVSCTGTFCRSRAQGHRRGQLEVLPVCGEQATWQGSQLRASRPAPGSLSSPARGEQAAGTLMRPICTSPIARKSEDGFCIGSTEHAGGSPGPNLTTIARAGGRRCSPGIRRTSKAPRKWHGRGSEQGGLPCSNSMRRWPGILRVVGVGWWSCRLWLWPLFAAGNLAMRRIENHQFGGGLDYAGV